jgi:hypothetical protein
MFDDIWRQLQRHGSVATTAASYFGDPGLILGPEEYLTNQFLAANFLLHLPIHLWVV